MVERVAEAFSVLLKCVDDTSADPHTITSTNVISLVRGVARKLATDLCRDVGNSANCEHILMKKWGLWKMSAVNL